MVIARERYLDDGANFHVTLELVSRTVAMHGVLTGAPPEVLQRIGGILVEALDEIAAALADRVGASSKETSSFGCGT